MLACMNFTALVFLFIVMPALELFVLLKVNDAMGPGLTFLLVVVTGVAGAALAKSQGLQVLRRIQTDMGEGRTPAPMILDGLMVLVAGALLITPGLITDTVGFLLLIPPARAVIKAWLARELARRMQGGSVQVIDVTDISDDTPEP